MDPIDLFVDRGDESLVVRSDRFAFHFHATDLAPRGGNAAAIVALPVAMRLGRDLQVHAPVCPVLRDGLNRLSAIWSVWRPDLYRAVKVRSDGDISGRSDAGALPRIMAYSGGIDSTFALRQWGQEGAPAPVLMTVQGMDYRLSDDDRFVALMTKTAAFRSAFGAGQLRVGSDAASVMRRFGVSSYLGFGFQIFACLRLFEDRFSGCAIAADYAPFQEIAVGPRGTGTVTDGLFASPDFQVTTLGTTHTRAQKAEALASHPLALSALTFCKDYAVRPDNCGRCSKCQRTKAMFWAATGAIPPVFRDLSFDPANLRGFDLSRSYERVFALDILQLAGRHGRRDAFSGLVAAVESAEAPTRAMSLRGRLYQARMLLRSRLGLD